MASPANSIVVSFDELRSLAFGSIGASYAAVGTAFTHPVRIIKITNNTDADLLISFDGTTNNEIVPTGSFVLYDYNTNRSSTAGEFVQASGTIVYAKRLSGAASSGSVYVTAVCAYNN